MMIENMIVHSSVRGVGASQFDPSDSTCLTADWRSTHRSGHSGTHGTAVVLQPCHSVLTVIQCDM